jgi:WD40 repeat protein
MSENSQQTVIDQPKPPPRPRPGRRRFFPVVVLVAVGALTAALGYTYTLLERARTAELVASERADIERKMAQKRERDIDRLRRGLYAADMHLAYRAWESGNVALMHKLLDGHAREWPDQRGFEWHYLHNLGRAERVIPGQVARVVSLAVAPVGGRVACGCADGTVQVYDLANGKELLRFTKHVGEVRGVAFSPDGTRLATGGKDGVLCVWGARDGKLLRTLGAGPDEIWGVAFDSTGKYLAAGAGSFSKDPARGGGKLYVWAEGQAEPVFTSADWRLPVRRVAFSRDGTRLAAGTAGSGAAAALRVWRVTAGPRLSLKETWSATGQEADGVLGLAWNPDGTVLASAAAYGNKVRLWDGETGEELRALMGHQYVVTSVAFSPDGKTLVSGSRDHTVRVWDADSGEQLANLRGHLGQVAEVAFLPGGRIVSAPADLTKEDGVKVWLPGAAQDVVPPAERLEVGGLAFSPDGKRLAGGCYNKGEGELRVWDVAGRGTSDRPVPAWPAHKGRIYAVAFSPDGGRLASGGQDGKDGKVRVWDAATFARVLDLDGPGRFIAVVAYSPDGRWLVAGGATAQGGELRVWDAKTGAPHQTVAAHAQAVSGAAFSPDGKRLATCGYDGGIKVWDADTFKELAVIEKAPRVYAVAFSPDGKVLASGHGDQTVRTWNSVTGTPVKTIEGHTSSVQSVVFHPDGKRLVSKDRRGTTRVWDAQTGHEVLAVPDRETTRSLGRLAVSPDGHWLAVSGQWGQQRLRVWDARPVAVGKSKS